MSDDELKEVVKDERPSFLKEAREERKNLEKVRDELKVEIENLRALREEDILSGRVTQPKQEIKKEFTAQEYVDLVMAGKIPEQQK